MEGDEVIDENYIEKIIPNFGNLSKEDQKSIKEQLYRKQLMIKDIDRTLAEIIEKQQKKKKVEDKKEENKK